MNLTTQIIIERLPKKPLLTPSDIAAAYGLATTNPVLADIKTGRLEANRINGKFLISSCAAQRYVAENEVRPDEGTLS